MGATIRVYERVAGTLSLLAGSIHGWVTPAHFEEWWGYGLFFAFAGAAQMVLGLALLTDAVNPKDTGPSWKVWKRRIYLTGIFGNLFLIVLYGVTRTLGVPLFGPEAGEVESIGVLDITAKVLEVAVIILLGSLLVRSRRDTL